MPSPRKTYAPGIIIQARQEYVDGRIVERIVETAGTNTGTFYKWLAGEVPGMSLPPIRRRRVGVRRLRPLKSMRLALVTRLWHSAEQQVREIEQRLAGAGQQPPDRERDARALAMLVRTLRELAAMDRQDGETTAKPDSSARHDDDVRDIDEFRRDLARQMDAIIARRADRAAGKSEAS